MPVLTRRRRMLTLAATGVTALSLAAGAGQAVAATAQTCTIKSFAPTKFVVNATDTERTFTVKTSGCTQKSWRIDLVGGEGESNELLATKAKPVVTFDPTLMENVFAGKYEVLVTVKSTDDKTSKKTFTFSLLRRSTFGSSFNIGPEPATAGATLKVVGNLKRVSWGTTPKYVNYTGRTVRLQFKASGTATFVDKKTLTTDAAGQVASTIKVTKSGTWRLHYAGNSTTGASDSTTDAVTVR